MSFNKKNIKLGIGYLSISIILFGLFQNFTDSDLSEVLPSSQMCDSVKLAEILAKPTHENATVQINCSFKLSPSSIIGKQILLEGSVANGAVIDCNGGIIIGNQFVNQSNAILVKSIKKSNLAWDVPKRIQIKNCTIQGSVRTIGMATNGEGPLLRESSRLDSLHTVRAQMNAPSDIIFDNIQFETNGGIPLYIGPGSTKIQVLNSKFTGKGQSVAIYMDAESAQNQIKNNLFMFSTGLREIIAIDGSAFNLISGNTFKNMETGGVFIYRNCGEGGTVRHQKPIGNKILKNIFYHQDFESINVGSRKGNSIFCSFDAGYPFGSSISDLDFAENTTIADNKFFINKENKVFFSRYIISSSEPSTIIGNNQIIGSLKKELSFDERIIGKFTDAGSNAIKEK